MPGLECLSDPQILPILFALDPDSLLSCGRANRRLNGLVCDQQVWKHLLKGIDCFGEVGSLQTESKKVGNSFPGYQETFQIIRKISSLSGNFSGYPETFRTIRKISKLSENFPGYSENLLEQISRLSGNSPDYPKKFQTIEKTFQTIQKLS